MHSQPGAICADWCRFVALGLVLLCLAAGCKQQDAPKSAPVALAPVSLCCATISQLPMVVAEQQGFFAEQGLAVQLKVLPMGQDALGALLKGECDFGVAAEPPVVESCAQRDDLRILGSVQSSDNMIRLVGRQDRGVGTPLDLRGKRIGVVKGTNAHYFLELFLNKHGLEAKDVVIVFMKSDELLAALTSGQVDALSMTNKVIVQAQQALGDKAVLMEAPGLYRSYLMLLTTSGLLAKRPGLAVPFLRALQQAEDFIGKRPEEMVALGQASQKISPAEIKQLLGIYQYQLTLDHAMLMGLEDTNRWTLQQAGDSRRPVVNFLTLIAAEPLQAVRPDSVRLAK